MAEHDDDAVRLSPGRLTWGVCRQLGKRIRPGDAQECLIQGFTPEMAMFSGIGNGNAYTALNGDKVIGAFGWTKEGRIWSLWSAPTYGESKAILKKTPEWVGRMVAESGRPMLDNYVLASNRRSLGWLAASKCFAIDPYAKWVNGGFHYYFSTRADVLRHHLSHPPVAVLLDEAIA